MGRILLSWLILSKLTYAEPQMPPRRQPTEMEQLMAAQAQLTQVMTQFMANQNNNNGNNQPQGDALTRFLRLRPAKFSTATEPMVALDWLRSVNKDLVPVGCTDAEKVMFAAHLLEGPAASGGTHFRSPTRWIP